MVRRRTAGAKKGLEADGNIYTFEQLPDERKKRYASLLEDFDRQIEAHIAEANDIMKKEMQKIRNAYKVALFQIPTTERLFLQEEVVKNNDNRGRDKSVRESSIIPRELDKVSENIQKSITNQVAKVEKSAKKRGRGGGTGASTVKKAKNKRSISEPPPQSTGLRRSTRKRIPSERTLLAMETPYAGRGGLAKGPLTSTAYANRTRGSVVKNSTLMETPCGSSSSANPFAFADVSNVLPAITPKFNMVTPLHKQLTVMRPAKQNETIISLGGSPIYVGQTARKNRRGKVVEPALQGSPNENRVALNLGGGRRLMVPTTEGEQENAQPLDLDEAALERIKALRNQLNSLLNMRNHEN